ncbi:hypothetical protein CLV24_10461 [Pontibacter ummariensis]|uniref:DUF4369 domain-containing protein n=1 Tax=Pontibacter ummariensis TaxID=1610492 RepID=A0A239D5V5_9BACT|nr:hypothetical protein [Pontibacter ummariensis]PRY14251.1 hypothetical protein CLV24_10461 [Pontibacter ummariensis]SNS27398.1 hypothetical protein SAMN06296052_10460 [Pontibacter ummariensis]
MVSQKVFFKVLPLLAFVAFLSSQDAFAQGPDKIKISPENGGVNADIRKKAYRYSSFVDGRVTFLNGTTVVSKLNYNLLTGEIEFIDSSNDTLALADLFTIHSIAIGDDQYFYDKEGESLLKLLEDYASTKLLIKEKYELADIKNKGAMGKESSSLSPTTTGMYSDAGGVYQLSPNATMEFTVKSAYYLADINDHYVEANKRNTLKLFSDHKSSVAKYIKENKPDFDNEEELRKLLQHCNKL